MPDILEDMDERELAELAARTRPFATVAERVAFADGYEAALRAVRKWAEKAIAEHG